MENIKEYFNKITKEVLSEGKARVILRAADGTEKTLKNLIDKRGIWSRLEREAVEKEVTRLSKLENRLKTQGKKLNSRAAEDLRQARERLAKEAKPAAKTTPAKKTTTTTSTTKPKQPGVDYHPETKPGTMNATSAKKMTVQAVDRSAEFAGKVEAEFKAKKILSPKETKSLAAKEKEWVKMATPEELEKEQIRLAKSKQTALQNLKKHASALTELDSKASQSSARLSAAGDRATEGMRKNFEAFNKETEATVKDYNKLQKEMARERGLRDALKEKKAAGELSREGEEMLEATERDLARTERALEQTEKAAKGAALRNWKYWKTLKKVGIAVGIGAAAYWAYKYFFGDSTLIDDDSNGGGDGGSDGGNGGSDGGNGNSGNGNGNGNGNGSNNGNSDGNANGGNNGANNGNNGGNSGNGQHLSNAERNELEYYRKYTPAHSEYDASKEALDTAKEKYSDEVDDRKKYLRWAGGDAENPEFDDVKQSRLQLKAARGNRRLSKGRKATGKQQDAIDIINAQDNYNQAKDRYDAAVQNINNIGDTYDKNKDYSAIQESIKHDFYNLLDRMKNKF